MKNYELIEELSKLPAGCKISLSGRLKPNEVTYVGDQDGLGDDDYYIIDKDVSSVTQAGEVIIII